MLATVAWIGGLGAVVLLLLPIARKRMDAVQYADLLAAVQRRLDLIGWSSLVVLTASGMFQMSANTHYEGFLAVTNPWARAILFKHIVIFGMVAVNIYLTWGVAPALKRAAFKQARQLDAPEGARLQKRAVFLLSLNLVLGSIVLALTALARSA